MIDRARIRKIIQLAAKEAPSAREWLIRDEFGTWEREVNKLLDKVALKPEAADLSESKVNEEVAIVIAYLASSAMLARAKKKSR